LRKLTDSERIAILKEPIVSQCQIGDAEKKCSRIEETVIEGKPVFYCRAYAFPAAKWRNGKCNLADHLATQIKKDTKKVNPLKASKRGG
jgi:hypothetical protein